MVTKPQKLVLGDLDSKGKSVGIIGLNQMSVELYKLLSEKGHCHKVDLVCREISYLEEFKAKRNGMTIANHLEEYDLIINCRQSTEPVISLIEYF
jgi:glutamyl-tRNA reductase